jgi:hypothetical protein
MQTPQVFTQSLEFLSNLNSKICEREGLAPPFFFTNAAMICNVVFRKVLGATDAIVSVQGKTYPV